MLSLAIVMTYIIYMLYVYDSFFLGGGVPKIWTESMTEFVLFLTIFASSYAFIVKCAIL